MAAQSDDIRVLRFSTDELPERDRLPIMREVHGRLMRKGRYRTGAGRVAALSGDRPWPCRD